MTNFQKPLQLYFIYAKQFSFHRYRHSMIQLKYFGARFDLPWCEFNGSAKMVLRTKQSTKKMREATLDNNRHLYSNTDRTYRNCYRNDPLCTNTFLLVCNSSFSSITVNHVSNESFHVGVEEAEAAFDFPVVKVIQIGYRLNRITENW